MSDYTSYSSYSPDARLMLTLCLAEDSILLEEVTQKRSLVYVNLSGGTQEYAAAAAIC